MTKIRQVAYKTGLTVNIYKDDKRQTTNAGLWYLVIIMTKLAGNAIALLKQES